MQPGQHELEQLVLDGDVTQARVEAPRRAVVALDDDLQRARVLRDRVPLGVLEQAVPHAAPLVPGGDEDLFDQERDLPLGAKREIPSGPRSLVRSEDDVAQQCVEYATVVPARLVREDGLRDPEELVELRVRWADDVDLAVHLRTTT